jgi:tripartite-type tricarboxylate transporter receptor subunit TctC
MRAGKVRPIFTGTSNRLPVLPDVPSSAEVGLAEFDAASWLGMAVTGGTPMPVQMKLHDEIVAIVKSQRFKDAVEKLGMTTMDSGSPEELDTFAQKEIVRWGEVVRKSGATSE